VKPLHRHATNSLSAVHRRAIRKLARNGNTRFFDPAEFPWVREIEAEFPKIRADVKRAMRGDLPLPKFSDISPRIDKPAELRTLVFQIYGREIKENCAHYPDTARVLRKIPGMRTAMFSVLKAGIHIPMHTGPSAAVLRYHLGLVVPSTDEEIAIHLDDEVRTWAEGKSMIFDDTFDHEVWNRTAQDRAILHVDFDRPLSGPLAVLNRALLRVARYFPDVTELQSRASRLASRGTPQS
jgi:aspartyl/asparaginyl beta-hydroxylase (cupin superfamily)